MEQEKHVINWEYLHEAISFYKSQGFKYIEVPWLVPNEITKITSPHVVNNFTTYYGDLVGSSEQSFLHLTLDKDLPKGKYVALTPCFREDNEDMWHQKYFMKVELFITDDTSQLVLNNTIDLCQNFFEYLAGFDVNRIATDIGFDIEYNKIELGSYGIREYKDTKWIYATGLAEPRFSDVMNFSSQIQNQNQ